MLEEIDETFTLNEAKTASNTIVLAATFDLKAESLIQVL
jgi:hypothetical protein